MLYKTENGYNVELTPIANIEVYKYISRVKLVTPKVPVYEAEDGRLLENLFSPQYNDALAIHDFQRHQIARDAIINKCVRLITKTDLEMYEEPFKALVSAGLVSANESLESFFIKSYVLTENDLSYIVENTLLTEYRVSTIMESIRVTRENVNIFQVHLKNAIQTRIEVDAIVVGGHQIVSPLDELKAAQNSMQDWTKWLSGEISLEEKSVAVALYRLDRTIEMHSSDAVAIAQEKEARKKNKH